MMTKLALLLAVLVVSLCGGVVNSTGRPGLGGGPNTLLSRSATGVVVAAASGSGPASRLCEPSVILHSNRSTTATACPAGELQSTCEYACDDGYIPIGRHVCQTYTTEHQLVLDHVWHGGRCQRLCDGGINNNNANNANSDCAVPLRYNSSDAKGPCHATKCFDTPDDLFHHLTVGNYQAWKIARNPVSGIYLGPLDLSQANQTASQGALGVTGVGLVFECVATALGLVSVTEAQERVMLTLRSMAGLVPGFHIVRNSRGMFPSFVDVNTGAVHKPREEMKYALMATGLNTAGILFAKTYFENNHPDAAATKAIASLATKLYHMVNFTALLCNKALEVDPNGAGIPMVQHYNETCAGVQFPQDDGFYQYNEEHYTVWFAFEQACGAYAAGQCPNKAIEAMWQAWQGRRHQPNHSFQGLNLLSLWPSYLVQLPCMVVHPFNSDPTYLDLFRQHWKADMAFFATDAYNMGGQGRYGLAAGTTIPWCAGSGYLAEKIVEGKGAQAAGHCRIYSPYAIAGFMLAAPSTISQHLLDLAQQGDSVYTVPGGGHVMARKSTLDLGWNQSTRVTMVDFSSELFGLATRSLGLQFFQDNSNHFPNSSATGQR
eukprot:m.90124 g.90124  ORF g.90124 m.90124 type:complete len:603 (-) comp14993_c1_seq4:80-1888(-)